MTGKEKCDFLKGVRMKIAVLNDIEYRPRECHHEGACSGICPACEIEAEELMSRLFEKEVEGIPIKVDTNILAELDHLASSWNVTDTKHHKQTEGRMGDLAVHEHKWKRIFNVKEICRPLLGDIIESDGNDIDSF